VINKCQIHKQHYPPVAKLITQRRKGKQLASRKWLKYYVRLRIANVAMIHMYLCIQIWTWKLWTRYIINKWQSFSTYGVEYSE